VLLTAIVLFIGASGVNLFATTYSATPGDTVDTAPVALLVPVMGFPVLVAGLLAGMAVGGRSWSRYVTATPWDVARVDFLALALAASDPTEMLLDMGDDPRGERRFGKPALVAMREHVTRRVFAELIEDAAARTLYNFASGLKSQSVEFDRETQEALTQRGAGIATYLRQRKLMEYGPEASERATVFREAFRRTASNDWAGVTADGSFTIARKWWRTPVTRVATAVAIGLLALAAPLLIEGPGGLTARAGLAVVAVTAIFSPAATVNQRAYDVAKGAMTNS
jgi:hypothetical protein